MEAKIDNFSTWVNSADHVKLTADLHQLLADSGFTVLDTLEHAFEPEGYTALWLIAESHCALHTFPEEERSYVELSSCNTQMFVDFVRSFNAKYFGTNP